MIEVALTFPLLVLITVSGLLLGMAQVRTVQLERHIEIAGSLYADGEFDALEVETYLSGQGATTVCVSDAGACFVDGLTVPRVQIVATTNPIQWPMGVIVPTAKTTVLTP